MQNYNIRVGKLRKKTKSIIFKLWEAVSLLPESEADPDINRDWLIEEVTTWKRATMHMKMMPVESWLLFAESESLGVSIERSIGDALSYELSHFEKRSSTAREEPVSSWSRFDAFVKSSSSIVVSITDELVEIGLNDRSCWTVLFYASEGAYLPSKDTLLDYSSWQSCFLAWLLQED